MPFPCDGKLHARMDEANSDVDIHPPETMPISHMISPIRAAQMAVALSPSIFKLSMLSIAATTQH